MSDDIAAELLATAKLYDDAGVDGSAGADMCRAAAAELARLRAEVARLREVLQEGVDLIAGDAVDGEWKKGCRSFLKAARAELEGGET